MSQKNSDYGQIQLPRLSYKCKTPEGDTALYSQCTHTAQTPHLHSLLMSSEKNLKKKQVCMEEQCGLEIAEWWIIKRDEKRKVCVCVLCVCVCCANYISSSHEGNLLSVQQGWGGLDRGSRPVPTLESQHLFFVSFIRSFFPTCFRFIIYSHFIPDSPVNLKKGRPWGWVGASWLACRAAVDLDLGSLGSG